MKHKMPNPFSIYLEPHLKPTWPQIQTLLIKILVKKNSQRIDSNKMNDTWDNKYPYFTQNPHRKITPLGQSYESALQELLTGNLITLLNTWGFEPKVKSSWWNEAHYCDFHWCKGHLMSSCMQLKHKIHDLFGQNIIQIGPQSNTNHGVFKNPLPNYE